MTGDVTFSVRCERRLHKITVRENGSVVLHGHLDWEQARADKACMILGGRPCRCYEVLEEWKQGRTPRAALRAKARAIRAKQHSRAKRGQLPPVSDKTIRSGKAATARVRRLVMNVLPAGVRVDLSFFTWPTVHADLYGLSDSRCAETARDELKITLFVALPLDWLTKVVVPGFAKLRNCLVVSVDKPEKDGEAVVSAIVVRAHKASVSECEACRREEWPHHHAWSVTPKQVQIRVRKSSAGEWTAVGLA